MLAAHAARPICPRCSRPVRTGVEIRDACADVDRVLFCARRRAAGGAREDLELYDTVAGAALEYVRELQAELAGEHLDCRPALDFRDLFNPAALLERIPA